MFIQSTFIKKNTPELRKKLEELGYIPSYKRFNHVGSCTQCNSGNSYACFDAEYENGKGIDCGTNEDLFLALAALRDDSDYMQWFFNERIWFTCGKNDIRFDVDIPSGLIFDCEKATPAELIEHFKNQ